MTTTSAATDTSRRSRGFSLVEVLMAVSLSSLVLAGVFSATIFVNQSGFALENYSSMEGSYQRMLTRFSRDAWMASDAKWVNSHTLRLETIKGEVEYRYVSADGAFIRKDSSGENILLTDISSLQFRAFDSNGNDIPLQGNFASASTATKSTQLVIQTNRSVPMGWSNDASLSTARFMLRNKLAH